jgi:hypothetical protein
MTRDSSERPPGPRALGSWRFVSPAYLLLRAAIGTSGLVVTLYGRTRAAGAGRAVSRDTGACLEGYPRSGNTFVTIAFSLRNPAVKQAHHLHLSGQVRAATRRGIPTAVLVREPAEAAASLIRWMGYRIGPATALLYYVMFNAVVERRAADIIVCRFEEAVAHPETMVERVNAKFGTSFVLPDIVNDADAIQEIRARFGIDPPPPRRAPADEVLESVLASRWLPLAKRYYEALLAHAS